MKNEEIKPHLRNRLMKKKFEETDKLLKVGQILRMEDSWIKYKSKLKEFDEICANRILINVLERRKLEFMSQLQRKSRPSLNILM